MARSLPATIRAANAALLVRGDLESVGEYFTADYVAHVTGRDFRGGHAWVRRYVRMVRRGFTDLKVEVEILLVGKDRVAWQRTLRGRHTGAFMGFPATGRKIVWRDMVTSRFRRGRIAEDWVVADLAERLLLARKR